MNERIKKLQAVLEKDIQRRDALNDKIRKGQAKLKELKRSELFNRVTVLSEGGMNMDELFTAIQNKDFDMLMDIMENMAGSEPAGKETDNHGQLV